MAFIFTVQEYVKTETSKELFLFFFNVLHEFIFRDLELLTSCSICSEVYLLLMVISIGAFYVGYKNCTFISVYLNCLGSCT
jgi:hypothetical protein